MSRTIEIGAAIYLKYFTLKTLFEQIYNGIFVYIFTKLETEKCPGDKNHLCHEMYKRKRVFATKSQTVNDTISYHMG